MQLFELEMPDTIDGKPTRNSEGRLIHPTEQGIRNFWKWFGDSTLVDQENRPLVLYHGTGRSYEFFNTPVKWFAQSEKLSNTYAEYRAGYNTDTTAANTIVAYVKLLNPFDSTSIGDKSVSVGTFFSELLRQSGGSHKDELYKLMQFVKKCARREESGPHYSLHDFWYENTDYFGKDGARAIALAFKLCGFDGIFYIENGIKTWGVFDNRNIKSAIGNSGKFSPKTGKITETEEELIESVSSEVFHATSIRNIFNILKQREFKLTTSAGTSAEQMDKKRMFYMSVSRSPASDYAIHNAYNFGAMINLRGDWFNQRYRGGPVDYWERMWWSKEENKTIGGRTSEQEDRVFSHTSTIPLPKNPNDLIESLHLLINIGRDFGKVSGYIRGVLIEAKKMNIPVYFYTEKNAWLVQDKNKTLPVSEFIEKLSGEAIPSRSSPRDWFKEWRELYFKNEPDQLTKKAKELLYKINQYRDTARSLETDIHNAKTNITPALQKLLDIFRKLKITTAAEYVEILKEKWKRYM